MPVFYLGPDGDDGHSGTRESPWKTLEQANKALRPGDTAVLLPGTYEGTIRPSINGRVNAPIVYRSEAQHQAVLIGNGGEPWPIELQEKDYITLEGLSVMPGEGGWVNASRCTHLAIQGCRMEKSGKTTPLRIEDSRHVRLIDNVLRKDRTDGNMCSIYRCTYGLFEGNALSHAGHNPFIFSGNNNAMIRSNSFHNPWGRNYALHASGKIVFERNIVTEALDSAHSANSPSKNSVADGIIRFNRVFRNWHTPLNSPSYVPPEGFFIRRPFGLVNTRLYNNTITGGLGHAWETGGISITSNVFSNNLFFANDPYGEGVQVRIGGEITRDNLFLNNVFRGVEPGQRTVRYGDAYLTTAEANELSPRMRDWSMFQGNLDVDPHFLDPQNHDFRLRRDSPCIDAGRHLTRTAGAGEGREVSVDDARYFYDGFGIEGEQGDWVAIGRGDRIARIEAIEFNYYQPDVLILDRDMAWEADAPVSFPWSGKGPDIGAHQHEGPLSLGVQAKAEPGDAKPGETVTLCVEHLKENVDRVEWDFGDSTGAIGQKVSHAYTCAENHRARVRVHYADGTDDLDVAFVKVAEPRGPDAPMLQVDFEEPDTAESGRFFKFYRGNRETGFEFVEGGYRGTRSIRLYATGEGSDLSCALAPGEWDIDAYPFIRFAYKIPSGVPLGIWLQPFPTIEYGDGIVIVGGTPGRDSGPHPDTGTHSLVDDGEWHEATVDARDIRTQYPKVSHLRRFRFYTHQNGVEGQEYWFDDFAILPDR